MDKVEEEIGGWRWFLLDIKRKRLGIVDSVDEGPRGQRTSFMLQSRSLLLLDSAEAVALMQISALF